MSLSTLVAKHGVAVQFKRRTRSKTRTGSMRSTVANLGAATTGWLQPISSRTAEESEGHGTRGIDATHKLYVLADPDVHEGDIVTIAGADWLVQTEAKDQAGVGTVWRVDIKREVA